MRTKSDRLASLGPAPARRAYYDAASASKRLSNWITPIGSVNAAIVSGGEMLRARARHAVRNNAWAANAIASFTANAVGTGIKPQFKHPDQATRERLTRLWRVWTDEADADGLTDFYGQQALACRSTMESGECLARLRPRRLTDGLTVPLQVQLIESEHLPFSKNEEVGAGIIIRAGIEFNAIGSRTAYYLYRQHPGDRYFGSNGGDLVRVPSDSVLHLYQPLRPGQYRGQPWLTTILLKLHELERYDDAELVRKKLAAMLVAVIYDDDDQSLMAADDEDEDGTPLSVLEPGTTTRLRGAQRVEFSDPKDVGGMYPEFMRVQLRAIAAGLGITYEQLTGDLTGVNYSSIRAGLLEFRRRVEQFQHQIVVFQFCRPVLQMWLEQAALAGKIDARDYAENREAYLDVDWRAAAWPWVDPEKDVRAAILEVRAGFTSRDAVIHERGEDPEEVDRQSAASNQRAEQLGLDFPELSDSGGSKAVVT